MEYIVISASLLLLIVAATLAAYNLLYAYRTIGVNKQLGLSLPKIIQKLFIANIILSIIVAVISLLVFIKAI